MTEMENERHRNHPKLLCAYIVNVDLRRMCSARQEAQGFLSTLRDEKIPQKLPESNIGRFEVEWLADQEGTESEKHTEYVEVCGVTTYIYCLCHW